MEIAKDNLNHQALLIEEAENEIRLIVKNGYMQALPKRIIGKQVEQVIHKLANKITTANLRTAVVESLQNFALNQYNHFIRAFGIPSVFLFVLANVANSDVNSKEYIRNADILKHDYSNQKVPVGVPLQTYAKEYINKHVAPVLDELAKRNALDPDDLSGRNSLRNRAEMEVRYDEHLSSIEELRSNGTRLVIASTHADCSERCAPFQGKVFSLDGTSGTTSDGRKYVPLEVATDVFYTTKKGKVYKNGLLGFNCRHYLMPYRQNFVPPKISAKEEKVQRDITKKQRELERNVRVWKTKALEYKNIDNAKYAKARKNAMEWNKRYIKFSKDNERAYYPDRTKII